MKSSVILHGQDGWTTQSSVQKEAAFILAALLTFATIIPETSHRIGWGAQKTLHKLNVGITGKALESLKTQVSDFNVASYL